MREFAAAEYGIVPDKCDAPKDCTTLPCHIKTADTDNAAQ
jgi:hypothetical protein